ncbi:MAG TPA: metalloregulator ArsR/SmtB family transcription factor [Chitinophagaceae bacterium]|nr:metalloregulator ArsR/SmtB family transcription factor [Chitinophagaceae bacterium]
MRRDIFQAIADPTRRAIISLIMLQSMTPNAIAEKFDSSRQAVSKHIKILQECGLVKSKQNGREIYYQIEVKKLKEVTDWLAPFQQMWEERFDMLDNYLSKIQKQKKHATRKK